MFKKSTVILLFILSVAGCKKEEEILTGSIVGTTLVYSQFGTDMGDYSGITVKLLQNSNVIYSTSVDQQGSFSFENIPYGKYYLNLEKEGFVGPWYQEPLYHVGGYSPSFTESYIYEVPTFTVNIDSFKLYTAESVSLILHITVSNDSVSHVYSPFRVFASNSPDVTSENYMSAGRGFFVSYDPSDYSTVPLYGLIDVNNFMDVQFELLKSGTIYLRIYPLALGQGTFIGEYRSGALGMPSNVITFKWEELDSIQGF